MNPSNPLRHRAVALSLCLLAGIGSAQAQSPAELESAAKAEAKLVSVGMPDDWANWKDTWVDLGKRYGIAHVDTDMSSAEEIAKMEAEKANATIDIGDIGFEFAPVAKKRGITQAYKPSTWAQIPAWAKDADGHWAIAYTGTIAFAVNTKRAGAKLPRSWKELAASPLRVDIGEVGRASQANAGVLAAAIALGGGETNVAPALKMFAELAKQGQLVTTNPLPALMERAEADVFILWDFNALSYRDKLPNKADYEIVIPSDGSVTSGYSTILNKYAPHPKAAALAREYIFSDVGQINLARGNARPIRIDAIKLPAELKGKLIDSTQYKAARPIQPEVWTESVKQLARQWQAEVMANAK